MWLVCFLFFIGLRIHFPSKVWQTFISWVRKLLKNSQKNKFHRPARSIEKVWQTKPHILRLGTERMSVLWWSKTWFCWFFSYFSKYFNFSVTCFLSSQLYLQKWWFVKLFEVLFSLGFQKNQSKSPINSLLTILRKPIVYKILEKIKITMKRRQQFFIFKL